jgi:hypothetical protein
MAMSRRLDMVGWSWVLLLACAAHAEEPAKPRPEVRLQLDPTTGTRIGRP